MCSKFKFKIELNVAVVFALHTNKRSKKNFGATCCRKSENDGDGKLQFQPSRTANGLTLNGFLLFAGEAAPVTKFGLSGVPWLAFSGVDKS